MFASGSGPVLLAHQGGWDEVLLIGGPIIVIAGLLILAKKRVDSALPDNAVPATESAETGTPDTDMPDNAAPDDDSGASLDSGTNGGETPN